MTIIVEIITDRLIERRKLERGTRHNLSKKSWKIKRLKKMIT